MQHMLHQASVKIGNTQVSVPSIQSVPQNQAMRQPLTLGVGEVDDFLVHEDVDLLNAGDSVDAQPLQSVLQPLVVCAGGLVHRLLLSAHVIHMARLAAVHGRLGPRAQCHAAQCGPGRLNIEILSYLPQHRLRRTGC